MSVTWYWIAYSRSHTVSIKKKTIGCLLLQFLLLKSFNCPRVIQELQVHKVTVVGWRLECSSQGDKSSVWHPRAVWRRRLEGILCRCIRCILRPSLSRPLGCITSHHKGSQMLVLKTKPNLPPQHSALHCWSIGKKGLYRAAVQWGAGIRRAFPLALNISRCTLLVAPGSGRESLLSVCHWLTNLHASTARVAESNFDVEFCARGDTQLHRPHNL